MRFFWHVTHNRIFTDMDEHLRKSFRTTVVANVSRILCLSCCWKKLVFLLVIRLKA